MLREEIAVEFTDGLGVKNVGLDAEHGPFVAGVKTRDGWHYTGFTTSEVAANVVATAERVGLPTRAGVVCEVTA